MSDDNENIDFTIEISGQYWDKKPMYSILVNDVEAVGPTEFDAPSNERKEISFAVPLPGSDETECLLKINLLNKESTDTKKDNYNDPDNYNIIDDMLLTVHDISIDGIKLPVGADFGDKSDDVGYYQVDEPVTYKGEENVSTIPGCTTMGWNGSYCYKFSTPVYLWLLEQIS